MIKSRRQDAILELIETEPLHSQEQLRRRVLLDLHYIEHWSLLLDLRILLMTVWVVLRGTQAY